MESQHRKYREHRWMDDEVNVRKNITHTPRYNNRLFHIGRLLPLSARTIPLSRIRRIFFMRSSLTSAFSKRNSFDCGSRNDWEKFVLFEYKIQDDNALMQWRRIYRWNDGRWPKHTVGMGFYLIESLFYFENLPIRWWIWATWAWHERSMYSLGMVWRWVMNYSSATYLIAIFCRCNVWT